MSGKVISFINMKGGVGKTTLCKEMALFFSKIKNKKILVVDIDPQSNCTQSLFERYKKNNIENQLTISNYLEKSVHKIFASYSMGLKNLKIEDVIENLDTNLDIIPGDLSTVFMERNSTGDMKLFNYMNECKLYEYYDLIFIDCPPTYSFYTVNALMSSNYYFVPVKPDAYSLLGLDLLENVVKDLITTNKAHFIINPICNLGVIFTMIGGSAKKGLEKNIEQIKNAFSDKDIYFFNNNFKKYDRISTGKIDTFYVDRKATDPKENLELICKEFEERLAVLNGNG